MSRFLERAGVFLKSEKGPMATEYAVPMAVIVAVRLLGERSRDTFQTVADTMD